MKRLIPPSLMMLFLLAGCGSGEPKAQLNLGAMAPAFETRRVDGTPVHFPRDWAGRPVAIRFWADWCKFCEGEMKAIEPVYQRHKGQGLEVLAINAGQDTATVQAFVNKIAISYPALLDEESLIARRYGVLGLPTTYFVDRNGIVRAKIVGEADAATFERQVANMLNAAAQAGARSGQ